MIFVKILRLFQACVWKRCPKRAVITTANSDSSADLKYMQNYNPLAPFTKGDFVKVPLRKGGFRGLFMSLNSST